MGRLIYLNKLWPKLKKNLFSSKPNWRHCISIFGWRSSPCIQSSGGEAHSYLWFASVTPLTFSSNKSLIGILQILPPRYLWHLASPFNFHCFLLYSSPDLSQQFISHLPSFSFTVHYQIVSFLAHWYHYSPTVLDISPGSDLSLRI